MSSTGISDQDKSQPVQAVFNVPKNLQTTPTTLKDFKLLQKIGYGAYSEVYKVIRLSDDKEYALKKVKMGDLSDKEKENALNEIRILASISHHNII